MIEYKQLRAKDIKPLREEMLKAQDNKCGVTGTECAKPVLDHAHKKRLGLDGCIRKVISNNINLFIGRIENCCPRLGIGFADLPLLLRQVAQYLEEQPHTNLIHPSDAPKAPKLTKRCYNEMVKVAKLNGIKNIPSYPKSRKPTKPLIAIYKKLDMEMIFYAK